MNENLREFLLAIESDETENATLFLGDAIRVAAPSMEWAEAQRIAASVVTGDDS